MCTQGAGIPERALRASSAVLSMWRWKNIIFHIQVLVLYFFATPPIKPKLGQQIGRGELLIANHLDQSLWWMGQLETLISSQITFITLFSVGAQNCCAFYESHCKLLYNYAEPKPFCWAKLAHVLPFLHPIFYSAGSHTKHRWRCSKGITLCKALPEIYFFSFLSCDTQLGIYRVSWKIEGSVQGVSY